LVAPGLLLHLHRLQHIELLAGDAQLGEGGGDGGIGLALVGDGPLIGLAAGPAGADQGFGAAGLGQGAGPLGAGLLELGLGALDLGALLGELLAESDRACGGLGERCLCLRQPGPPEALVQLDQRLAGGDALVVGDQDGGDMAFDPRREGGDVALKIGVVGRFQPAADQQPPVCRECQQEQGEDNSRPAQPAEPPAPRCRAVGWRQAPQGGFR
jgi:hypothetical protein